MAMPAATSTTACGAPAHKALKQRQVAYRKQLAHVAFEVAGHVIRKPAGGSQRAIVQGREAALEQQVVELVWQQGFAQFRSRQGE